MGRFRDWFRSLGTPEPDPEPTPEPSGFRRFLRFIFGSPEETPEPRKSDRISDAPFPVPESDLPKGWHFEGLYFANRAPHKRKVVNKDPSDSQVASADAIIVRRGTQYFTIHGARNRKHVGTQIVVVIIPESPR